jgi:hypothetical protein
MNEQFLYREEDSRDIGLGMYGIAKHWKSLSQIVSTLGHNASPNRIAFNLKHTSLRSKLSGIGFVLLSFQEHDKTMHNPDL